jgi:hypothetical protein
LIGILPPTTERKTPFTSGSHNMKKVYLLKIDADAHGSRAIGIESESKPGAVLSWGFVAPKAKMLSSVLGY